MKSNVCKIENGTRDLEAILNEAERVAQYNGLTHKQSLQLRLICEEMDGMLPNIINDFEGDFWIEFNDGVCKVNASIVIPEFNVDKRDELIALSKDKKNAAAVGISGKIRNAIEVFLLTSEATDAVTSSAAFRAANGYIDGVDYAYLWSLEEYRNLAKADDAAEAWDELEKSIIASAADDVVVGIKGKRADIVITKKFA